jgi:hypothetical protein
MSGNNSRHKKKSGRVLPHPSAVFHVYASADTPWVTEHYPICTPMKRGKVSSNSSTHEATQFGDSICPECVSIFKCLFILSQSTWGLTDTGRGDHLGAPNFRSRPLSTFPSIILYFPLIARPMLAQVMNTKDNSKSKKHIKCRLKSFRKMKNSGVIAVSYM